MNDSFAGLVNLASNAALFGHMTGMARIRKPLEGSLSTTTILSHLAYASSLFKNGGSIAQAQEASIKRHEGYAAREFITKIFFPTASSPFTNIPSMSADLHSARPSFKDIAINAAVETLQQGARSATDRTVFSALGGNSHPIAAKIASELSADTLHRKLGTAQKALQRYIPSAGENVSMNDVAQNLPQPIGKKAELH